MWIERLEMVARESDNQARAVNAIPLLRARYVVETEDWKIEPITEDSTVHGLLATGISGVASSVISRWRSNRKLSWPSAPVTVTVKATPARGSCARKSSASDPGSRGAWRRRDHV